MDKDKKRTEEKKDEKARLDSKGRPVTPSKTGNTITVRLG
jgi:hypothetical protein